jgi:CubicO group peptidase (beta-lactamase class C family)
MEVASWFVSRCRHPWQASTSVRHQEIGSTADAVQLVFVGSSRTANRYDRKDPQGAASFLAEGLCQEEGTLKESMRKLARIPLHFPPGEQWEYGVSSDVLGRVVEVASGVTFDEFLRIRVFEPLKMNDTHFFLPREKVSRLAVVYRLSKEGKLERLSGGKIYHFAISPEFGFKYSEDGGFPFSVDYPYRGPRSYFSGNAGLCSAVPDNLRFCQMLLNGGELDRGLHVPSDRATAGRSS